MWWESSWGELHAVEAERGVVELGRWDWENWAVLTTAVRWERVMLAREADLMPLARAALCCGGTKDKAAFLEERPLLPDRCLWGKLGPSYCGDDHELCVV